jgi:hypothetical protein
MSLKEICCAVVADELPEAILQQPDYRELLHRSLPVRQQTKLFGESRQYYPDGHLKCKTIGDKFVEKSLELVYAPSGYLGVCRVVNINENMILDIWFNFDGSITKIVFYNPGGYGFQLTRKGLWCSSLTIQYLNKQHGIHQHYTAAASFCSVYENGTYIGSIFSNKDLD